MPSSVVPDLFSPPPADIGVAVPDPSLLLDPAAVQPTLFHVAVVALLLVTQVRLLMTHLALLVVAAAGASRHADVRLSIGRRCILEVIASERDAPSVAEVAGRFAHPRVTP